MIGAATGPCAPRPLSPTRRRSPSPAASPASPRKRDSMGGGAGGVGGGTSGGAADIGPPRSPSPSRVRSSSPRLALSPRTTVPPVSTYPGMTSATVARRSHSPRLQVSSPVGRIPHGSPVAPTTPERSPQRGTGGPVANRRDGRFCVHADTNSHYTLYPNLMFDPDGDIIISSMPGTFDLSGLVAAQSERLTTAGMACGLLLAFNGDTKDPNKQVKFGTFFQVSPSRAIAAFHTACDMTARGAKNRELWVSKSCSISHWQSLFAFPKTRAKYFRRARLVRDFQEERLRLLQYYDGFAEKTSGVAPRVPIDIAILELPPDFRDDPYLTPLPKAKVKSVKKVGIISYNQREARDENNRAGVYSATAGIPMFDSESKYLHFGNKSISPGLFVAASDGFVTTEMSLGEGSAGAPLIPLTLAHYFWGIQACAYYDAEPTCGIPRSRNFNIQTNFYHPAVLVLYEKFVLGTLTELEQQEVRQTCYM